MGRFRLEGVVVQRAHLLKRAVLGIAQIKDGPNSAIAEVGRHLGLGVVARLRVPGGSLLGEFLLGLERIAATRSPVRMDVNDPHRLSLAHASLIPVVRFCMCAPAARSYPECRLVARLG